MLRLQARWVLPIDRPPLAGGMVTINQGRIVEVGPRRTSDGEVVDLGDVVLMPGLVNAHTHLEFSNLAQPLGQCGISLPDWIRLVISQRKQNSCDAQAGLATGMQESLDRGVTTIGEIATLPTSSYGNAAPNLLLFHEAIGFSAARVDSVLADITRRLKSNRDATNCQSNRDQGLSPHAPYTVHPQLLRRLVRLSAEQQTPVAMHLAESKEELRLLAEGDGPLRTLLEERSMWDPNAIAQGSRPLDYLQLLAEAPRSLVIHGNFLADDEIEFIGANRNTMSVVYCPRTHAYFKHDRYPLSKMLAAGVRMALGTDSRASNPDLCLLSEMRHVAAQHQDVSPKEIVAMGTLQGAKALGLANIAGSLTPGKPANLITLHCESHCHNPYEAVLLSSKKIHKTWLQPLSCNP